MYRTEKKRHKHITSFQVIIVGFFSVILLGSLFLMLPWATQDGQGASFGDALFTSTSAVCVTGLILHDTATYWSMFGQGIILFLIQIGGMGVVTVAVAIVSCIRKKDWIDAEKYYAGGNFSSSGRRHCKADKIYFENRFSY